MSTALDTLTQTPATLVPAALAGLILPASGVTPSDIQASILPGGKVVVTSSPSAIGSPGWMYYGHADATFTPMDLSLALGSFPLKLVLNDPAKASDVAALLATIFNIALSAADIIEESLSPITDGMPYLLKASPLSVMWTGQREVLLYGQTDRGVA